jgi:hypothetical protein
MAESRDPAQSHGGAIKSGFEIEIFSAAALGAMHEFRIGPARRPAALYIDVAAFRWAATASLARGRRRRLPLRPGALFIGRAKEPFHPLRMGAPRTAQSGFEAVLRLVLVKAFIGRTERVSRRLHRLTRDNFVDFSLFVTQFRKIIYC